MEMTLDEVRELVRLAVLMRQCAKTWADESIEDGDFTRARWLRLVKEAATDLTDAVGLWLDSALAGSEL